MTDLSRTDVSVVGPIFANQYFVLGGIVTSSASPQVTSLQERAQSALALSYTTNSEVVFSSQIISQSLTDSTMSDRILYCRCIQYVADSESLFRATIAVYLAIGRTPVGYLTIDSSGVLTINRNMANSVLLSMTNTCSNDTLYAGNPFSILTENLVPVTVAWNLCGDLTELAETGLCTQPYYLISEGITPLFIAIPTQYYQSSVGCQQSISPTVGGLPSPLSALQCKMAPPESEYATSSYCLGIHAIDGYSSQQDCYFSGSVLYTCSNSDNFGCGNPASYLSLSLPLNERTQDNATEVSSSYGDCGESLYCGYSEDQFGCIVPPEIPAPPPAPVIVDLPGPRFTPQQIRRLMLIAMIVVIVIGLVIVIIAVLLTRGKSSNG